MGARWLLALALGILLVLPVVPARAAPVPSASAGCDTPSGACPVFEGEPGAQPPVPEARKFKHALLFFWGVGCPHCEKAQPFLDRLSHEEPKLVIERVEVRRDAKGRERFLRKVKELGIKAPGIPTFVYDRSYIVGFNEGVTENQVRRLIHGKGSSARGSNERLEPVVLPIVGEVNPSEMPMPAFTLLVGLLDGINPCAMWVLLVLLGLLLHVRSRQRLLLFGGVFVLMSGIVYFLFMTVWVGLFRLVGISRFITVALGVVVLAMGLINLKELFWFKKGVSLTIPDQAKPGLYRRMRGVANAASLPAALFGITLLAFVVNLIELGCTLGLPAVYTRVLTLRADLPPAMHYAYLALYNLAYVVPLALIVAVYVATLHRVTLGERGAKVLKAVSGTLLVAFGLLFIVAPGILG